MEQQELWSQITGEEFERLGGQIPEQVDHKHSWYSITLPWRCDYMTMRMAAWIKAIIEQASGIDEPDSSKALLTNQVDGSGNPQPMRVSGRTGTYIWDDVWDQEMEMDDEVSVLVVEVDLGYVILTLCKTTDDYYIVRASGEDTTYLQCDDLAGLKAMLDHFEREGWPESVYDDDLNWDDDEDEELD